MLIKINVILTNIHHFNYIASFKIMEKHIENKHRKNEYKIFIPSS